MRILITGGAGFIGSHLADELLAHGYEVRVLDSLVGQVHPDGPPDYLDPQVELMVGDVRDARAAELALDGVDGVVHLAARVGVGQSMYEIGEYVSANTHGTAVLLGVLANRPVGRLVVASSMSVYGEGRYTRVDGTPHDGAFRTVTQLREKQWDPLDEDGRPLQPVPTPEEKRPDVASVYALNKYDQERLALIVGGAYGIPTVALRFFNVYGTRQSLSNPYTGVLAVFASRLLNGRPPLLFEDGQQRRDFVSVHDVARACRLALERPADLVAGRPFNVGGGVAWSVADVALQLAGALQLPIPPEVTGSGRVGDIRHCFADITAARRLLAYEPAVALPDGLLELVAWLQGQRPTDAVLVAKAELDRRGLTL